MHEHVVLVKRCIAQYHTHNRNITKAHDIYRKVILRMLILRPTIILLFCNNFFRNDTSWMLLKLAFQSVTDNVLGCNYPRSVCVRTAPGNVNMVAYYFSRIHYLHVYENYSKLVKKRYIPLKIQRPSSAS